MLLGKVRLYRILVLMVSLLQFFDYYLQLISEDQQSLLKNALISSISDSGSAMATI